MKYLALAVDYDGTIAHDSVVDGATLAALWRVRESGRKVILVTGRELSELLVVFPGIGVCDRVVAENGALVYDPATRTNRAIAPAPPPEFVGRLVSRGVPVQVGRSIVATVEPHEHEVLAAIRDLGLEWHVIFNKGAVMALPSGITKATGLAPVLEELKIPAEQVVAVGDAENDHALLRLCGCAVAVANALPSVKATSDLVTAGARGAGVAEVVERLLADDLCDVCRNPKRSNERPPEVVGG